MRKSLLFAGSFSCRKSGRISGDALDEFADFAYDKEGRKEVRMKSRVILIPCPSYEEGQVYEGMEVVDTIAQTGVDETQRPTEAVTINSVTITKYE